MATIQTGSVLDRTVLKEGQVFLVTDRGGDIKALNLEGHGLYYRDTRHLSLYDMELNGTRLVLLSSAGELNFMSNLQFANDTLLGQRGEVIAEARTISIRRNRFLHDSLHERLGIFNYNQHAVRMTVRFTVGSDFRDMFEVRGYYNDDGVEQGEILPIEVLPEGLVLRYRGRDRVERYTRISFDPPPASVEIVNDRLRRLGPADSQADPRAEGLVMPPMAAAVFDLELPPHSSRSITLHVAPGSVAPGSGSVPSAVPDGAETAAEAGRVLDAAFVGIRDSYDAWRAESTSFSTDNELFDQLLRRAMQDLRLLIDDVDDNLVPTAGIPWFAVPFGRDSLITAMQTLPLRPDVAAGTLRFLASLQGTVLDDFRDEEPGKILHEVRLGELAALGRVPHTRYYGSVDSTPLFLIALNEYVDWTGDIDLVRQLRPNLEQAVHWIDEYGDIDGDGFIEYMTRSPVGMRNQGWKDSPDSASHADGAWAEPPIALAEVQAYVYGARRAAARLLECLDDEGASREQRALADRVRRQFLERFAMEDDDGPFWAMGLDAEKRQIRTVTSNPGHALWTGMLSDEAARLTVRRLVREDMLSGWGLRTLSSKAHTFNPMSYHNGSIWPHDVALVALGMKRVGEDVAARELATQVFEAGLLFPGSRLPELYCGFARDRRYRSTPAQYPVSCSPQAWAAGSAFMLLQALLGLDVDALRGSLRLRPLLPAWLGHVRVRRLRVAGRLVDFDVQRDGHRMVVDVEDSAGLNIEVRDAVDG